LIIRRLEYNSNDYALELELRNAILRLPLGLDLIKEDLSAEVNDIHIGVFIEGVLSGVLVLTPMEHGRVKMRQVAVNEAHRGQGIGAAMVKYAEKFCALLGFSEIRLHARLSALSFYEKLGYIA